jgi:hypothetical protein
MIYFENACKDKENLLIYRFTDLRIEQPISDCAASSLRGRSPKQSGAMFDV